MAEPDRQMRVPDAVVAAVMAATDPEAVRDEILRWQEAVLTAAFEEIAKDEAVRVERARRSLRELTASHVTAVVADVISSIDEAAIAMGVPEHRRRHRE